MIASVGNEGKGAGESYHTSGPQCFIIYLQIPAKNWCYMEYYIEYSNTVYTLKIYKHPDPPKAKKKDKQIKHLVYHCPPGNEG